MVAFYTIFCHLAKNNRDLHSNCTLDKGTLGRDKINKGPHLRIFFWSPRQLPTCYYVVTALAIAIHARAEGGEY